MRSPVVRSTFKYFRKLPSDLEVSATLGFVCKAPTLSCVSRMYGDVVLAQIYLYDISDMIE